jgi:hypothetical protein
MKQKTLLAALLALCLLAAACGKKPEAAPAPLAGAKAYTADTKPCQLPLDSLSAACVSGEAMFLAGTVYQVPSAGAEGGETDGEVSSGTTYSFSSGDSGFSFAFGDAIRAALCRLDPAAGKAELLEGYVPEPGVSVMAVAPGADGTIWVMEQNMGRGETLDGLSDTASILQAAASTQVWRQLSADGAQELARIDAAQVMEGQPVSASLVDGAGRLYLASGSSVTAVDGGGNPLFTCKGQEDIVRLVPLADGAVGALTMNVEGGRTVTPIDPDAKSWGAPRPLTGSAASIYPGGDTYEFLYTSGDSLYGWPKGADAPQKLLSWSSSGIDCGQVFTMTFLPDGRGAALLWDDSDMSAAGSVALLFPADEDAMAGRTVLTLATMGLDSETRAMVMDFNRTSRDYRIEIQDYSEYNTPDDASAGLTKLNTEILTGKMPDLLDVSDALPLRQYAQRGYLEDLWPYIDSDAELGRAGVMERALQSAEIGGKLYQVFSSFTLDTLAGASQAVGDKEGWSLTDLRAAMEKMGPECCILEQNETRDSIFSSLFSRSLDRFVDWDAGTARFDSPEFQEILDFCASFPAQPGTADDGLDAMTRAVEGRQLLLRGGVLSLTNVKVNRELFGGNVTFVGYPDGQGIAARFQTEGSLAMSAACPDKEGAWSFLRRTLLPTGQTFFPSGFPINRADFDGAAEESMKVEYVTDENGETVTDEDGQPVVANQSRGLLGGLWIPLTPITQDDYDQVMDLYSTAGSLVRQDENIRSIALECAGGFFAGDWTAQEAAAAIQNRVELYLNEQK